MPWKFVFPLTILFLDQTKHKIVLHRTSSVKLSCVSIRFIFEVLCKLILCQVFSNIYLGTVKLPIYKSMFIISLIFETFQIFYVPSKNAKKETLWTCISHGNFMLKTNSPKVLKNAKTMYIFCFPCFDRVIFNTSIYGLL